MKLNKKTIYHVKTKELYDAIMKDAEKQGLKSWHGYKPTELDWWEGYKEDTCIRIDENGELNFCSGEYYKDNYKDHVHEEYKITPQVVNCFGGAVCIDAPTYELAYQAFQNYMNSADKLINMANTSVYTIRVEDDNTTVITPDGKMATAKCHPDDEFDIVEGFRVALEKIKERERKLTKEEYKILRALEVLGCDTFEIKREFELTGFYDGIYACDIDIEDEFSWLTNDKTYNTKEILEKYA